jgi:hypothetical protein
MNPLPDQIRRELAHSIRAAGLSDVRQVFAVSTGRRCSTIIMGTLSERAG